MEFEVVDIPDEELGVWIKLGDAMVKNFGKAIKVPLGTRDLNNMRKALRSSLASRNILEKYNLRTKGDEAANVLIVWLEDKNGKV